jgi:hypothetical protein
MPTKTFKTTIYRDGPMCFIPVSFDLRAVFGKIRAPVKVTLNRYTYRSTIASMGGTVCIASRHVCKKKEWLPQSQRHQERQQ